MVRTAALGLHDRRARRLLEVLDDAHGTPLTFSELRARGIDDPGQTLYELELSGVRVERVYKVGSRRPKLVGVRLAHGALPPAPEDVERSSRRWWRGTK